MDMALILDLSGSVSVVQDIIIEFAYQLLQELPVGSDVARVAMIVYADKAEAYFYLDTYTSKREILNAVVAKFAGGRTGTADALKLMYEDVFSAARGDRTGVTNYAVLVSDGGSNIRKDMTITEAREAHSRNIEIFSVAVGDHSYMEEMNDIASKPSNEYVLQLASAANISSVVDDLLMRVC